MRCDCFDSFRSTELEINDKSVFIIIVMAWYVSKVPAEIPCRALGEIELRQTP